MGDFITGAATPDLYLTKVTAPGAVIPPGLTVQNVTQAADLNAIESALLDVRTGLREGDAPVLAAGSTTRRTLAERFGEVRNALDFGATVSAVDSTAAVQAAINAAGARGTVRIPQGVTFNFNSLTIPLGVTVVDEANSRTVLANVGLQPGVFPDHATFRNARTATATRLYVMPNGAPVGTRAAFKLFGSDYTADTLNYQDFGLYYDATAGKFFLNSKGEGTQFPASVVFSSQDGVRVAGECYDEEGTGLPGTRFFGFSLGDVLPPGLARFPGVPTVFAKAAAFVNNLSLRWYNAAGTAATNLLRYNATDELEVLADGTQVFKATKVLGLVMPNNLFVRFTRSGGGNDSGWRMSATDVLEMLHTGLAQLQANINGVIFPKSFATLSATGAVSDATPTVVATSLLVIPTAPGPYNITDFIGASVGHRLTVVFSDANPTVVNSAAIKLLRTGGNVVGAAGKTLNLQRVTVNAVTAWHEV